jgi:hypothetical protein
LIENERRIDEMNERHGNDELMISESGLKFEDEVCC